MNNTKFHPEDNNKITDNNNSVPDSFDNNNNDSAFSLSLLLKDGARQGVKAIKLFGLSLFVFGVINLIFFIIHLIRHGVSDHYSYTALSLVTGIICSIIAFAFTYKYLLINTIEVCYKLLQPFFQKVCTKIIDKVIASGNKLTGKDIHKSLNVGSLMIEIYGKKLPKYIQKGLIFILGKIPFGDFVQNMHTELNQQKDNRSLSYILYLQVDKFISTTLFSGVSMNWIYWLLPLNIIIQIALLYLP